jgi:hypothetical protein
VVMANNTATRRPMRDMAKLVMEPLYGRSGVEPEKVPSGAPALKTQRLGRFGVING